MNRPRTYTIAAVLQFLLSVYEVVTSLPLLARGASDLDQAPDTPPYVIIALGLTAAVLGLVSAYGVWRNQKWGVVLTIILRAVDGLAALPVGTSGLDAQQVADLALVAGNASVARHLDGTAIDAGGLVPDVVESNTWVQTIDQISPVELLETQLCNYTAPFILISKLRPVMAEAASRAKSGRAYVVNVSAMEGVFNRGYKGAGHPNTNAAKAAINMVTRTSAQEMFQSDGILMTSVDTGWITDERPHFDKLRLAEEGFHAPLDLVDGAARVYDPVVRGEAGEDLYGVFLKDYAPGKW